MAKEKEVKDEDTKEITLVVAPQVPLAFNGNFDEVKKSLKADLAKYKKAVVTDANIERFKLAGREIASTRIMLTNRQKETLEMYIELPKNILKAQFAELLAIVEEAERNIKDQLDVFDNERKAELEAVLTGYRDEFQATYKLGEEYFPLIEMKKSYFNKTVKEKETKDDIEQQFKDLLAKQEAYLSDVRLIESQCKGEDRLNPTLFVKQLRYRTVSQIVCDITEEKERFINQVIDADDVPFFTAPVKKASPAAKVKTKEVTFKVSYPESSGDKLNTFFASNPEFKVSIL